MGTGRSNLNKINQINQNNTVAVNYTPSTSTATSKSSTPPKDLSAYRKLSWPEALKLRTQLNQDRINDRIYVGTSDSFSINAWLRKQQGGQSSGWVSLPESVIKQRVKTIDTWFKNTPYAFQTIRSVGKDWLRDNFGTEDKKAVASIINNNSITFIDNGYLSMSVDVNRNIFTGRGVILHLGVEQGTPIYVTHNGMESEVIAHRSTHTDFFKAEIRGNTLHIYGITK